MDTQLRGFDTLGEAKQFALANCPSVICERIANADGSTTLREIMRHDMLYDEQRNEWRSMLASIF